MTASEERAEVGIWEYNSVSAFPPMSTLVTVLSREKEKYFLLKASI